MARTPRITVPGYPHHVTQRGARRGDVFFKEDDRHLYMDMLCFYTKKFDAKLLDFVLMTNHVHHLIVPQRAPDLGRIFGTVHNIYARTINDREDWTGHLWQERFYSSVVDETMVAKVAVYIARNPVEANMQSNPIEYKWSSAAARAKGEINSLISLDNTWSRLIGVGQEWLEKLGTAQDIQANRRIEANLERDLPVGTENFVKLLEAATGRVLRIRNPGRPRKKFGSGE